MALETTYPHIAINSKGRPCINGTRRRVINIAADHATHGYNAAQMVEHDLDLTPAQVHTALTYYDDHQDAIDANLMVSYSATEHLREQHTLHPKLVAARARQTDG